MDKDTCKDCGSSDEFAGRVRSLFGKISPRYDLANHVLSLGVDLWWRRVLVRMSGVKAGESVLDMCCGTGDVAFAFAKYREGLRIVGCDFSEEMVEFARGKKMGLEVEWKVEDCCSTDFAGGEFDIVSCAFGVRNFAKLAEGLREMHRILKSDGRACILEFSLPRIRALRWAYLLYFKWVLPLVGGLISGNRQDYQYLVDSVLKWDRKIDLAGELREAGFGDIVVKRLSFGIATIHIAHKQ
ncbi:MAG: ubiquinone/menaquinone biosynthesis methyltransferase [Planctomycetes bacterium]|nr:ubiquinone/menaquinone biosynthesis methyltransferase [Planctomycetota bacterium]